MQLWVVVLIGAVMGFLDGVGILFAPEEPYRYQIILAATIKGVLVSLLTGLSLSAHSAWWQGVGLGALYGLAFGLVIFLAKGGLKSKDAPYVLPVSALTGAITGLLLIFFGF